MRHSLSYLIAGVVLLAWTSAAVRADEGVSSNGQPSLWFPVGEEIIYDIHWGVVPVGKTRILTSWVTNDSRRLLQIQIVTRTKSMMDKIYPVDDYIESLIDPETFLPVRFIKRLKEGGYRADETTLFDFKKLKAHWSSNTNKRQKDFAIEPDTRDIVCFMYYLRKFGFKPGETNSYRVMADEKMYDLDVVAQGIDVMKFPQYGPVANVRLNPIAAFQGIFVHHGEITVWVSEDPRHICTRVMAEVPMANIRLIVSGVRGPGDDFWLKPATTD